MQSLLQSLNAATNAIRSNTPTTDIIQPIHILQSLHTLCSASQFIEDSDYDLFESHLKEVVTQEAGKVADNFQPVLN